MVLDLHCISFIVYHLLSGILVIYFINIITSIITITLYYYIFYHYCHIYFFYTYVTLLGAISLTLCVFGGIHISDLTLLFFLFLLSNVMR